MNQEKTEVKRNIDEMAGKLFDYICAACDNEEAKNRMMEVALGFITATLDMNKSVNELRKELRSVMAYAYLFQMEAIIKIKNGNTENIVSEHRKKDFT